MKLRVLVACEFSGTVRNAFLARGHDAYSCDLLPTEGGHEDRHFQCSVHDVLDRGWDLMIAHPPCTYLASSGVTWLYEKPDRWNKMREGAEFFKSLLNAQIPRVCVENPRMHRYAVEIIGEKRTQIIHPWQYGHAEQKETGLWLRGLPNLVYTNNVSDYMITLPARERQRLHYLGPGPNRAKLRSVTYKGIAEAMADQWGNL